MESNTDDIIEVQDPSDEVACTDLLYHYNSDVMMDPRDFRYEVFHFLECFAVRIFLQLALSMLLVVKSDRGFLSYRSSES